MIKSMVAIFVVVFCASPSFALTMKELEGNYQISFHELSIVNFAKIKSNGDVDLTEHSFSTGENLKCTGKAKLKQEILFSEMLCENNKRFTQRINFQGVNTNQRDFKALVWSSLYNQELLMDFRKVPSGKPIKVPPAISCYGIPEDAANSNYGKQDAIVAQAVDYEVSNRGIPLRNSEYSVIQLSIWDFGASYYLNLIKSDSKEVVFERQIPNVNKPGVYKTYRSVYNRRNKTIVLYSIYSAHTTVEKYFDFECGSSGE